MVEIKVKRTPALNICRTSACVRFSEHNFNVEPLKPILPTTEKTERKVIITFMRPTSSGDKIPATKELMEQHIISAVICQQPAIQGSKPIQLLFDYLTAGEAPDREFYYTAVDIRILENL